MKLNEYCPNPNQRLIRIDKSNYCKSDYTVMGLDELSRAMNNLSGTAFKLYIYLYSNNNDFEFWLSFSHVNKITGLSKSSYQRAFKELVDKNYILKQRGRNNLYTFSDLPVG